MYTAVTVLGYLRNTDGLLLHCFVYARLVLFSDAAELVYAADASIGQN